LSAACLPTATFPFPPNCKMFYLGRADCPSFPISLGRPAPCAHVTLGRTNPIPEFGFWMLVGNPEECGFSITRRLLRFFRTVLLHGSSTPENFQATCSASRRTPTPPPTIVLLFFSPPQPVFPSDPPYVQKFLPSDGKRADCPPPLDDTPRSFMEYPDIQVCERP